MNHYVQQQYSPKHKEFQSQVDHLQAHQELFILYQYQWLLALFVCHAL